MLENFISWIEIITANYLREWQICSLAVQAAILFIGFAYYFKKGIGFTEAPKLRSFYYRISIFFVIMGLAIFQYITGVYYISDVQNSYMYKTLAISIGLTGLTLLFQNMEKLKIVDTKNIIPRILIGFTIAIYILILAPQNVLAPIFALIAWLIIPFALFLFISFQEKGRVRLQSLFLTFGFGLFLSGLIVIPTIIETFNPDIRFIANSIFYYYYNIGSTITVYSGLIMVLLFGRINYFIEIKWGEKIQSVIVLLKNGEIIIHKEFKPSEQIRVPMEEGKKFLEKFSKQLNETSNPPKIVEKDDITLFFDQGIQVLALLVTDENLNFYRVRLKEFVRDLELLYSDFLENYKGNPQVFESSYILFNRRFQIGGG